MPIYVDAVDDNADWPKKTWDVYDSHGDLVTTLHQARMVFGSYRYPDDFKAMLHNKSLPAQLRREIEAL